MQNIDSSGYVLGQIDFHQMHRIFKQSKLRKIENGNLGLPPPEPLGKGRPDFYYFWLGDDAFALMSWLVKSYNRRHSQGKRD